MLSSVENLKAVFDKMNADGWDTNGSLKWGFFFVDFDKDKLRLVFNELAESGYVMEDIYQTEDKMWTLNVSKVDCLTPEKLHKRNIAFNELADYCGIQFYDGWDVERINH